MANIIDFNSYRSRIRNKEKERIEAMMKGALEVYTCDTCSFRFEVLFDNKPDKCPGCGLSFEW